MMVVLEVARSSTQKICQEWGSAVILINKRAAVATHAQLVRKPPATSIQPLAEYGQAVGLQS